MNSNHGWSNGGWTDGWTDMEKWLTDHLAPTPSLWIDTYVPTEKRASRMDNKKFIEEVKKYLVKNNYAESADDLFVSWLCKTADNNKCLIGSTKDDIYWEATYIGSEDQLVVDGYKPYISCRIHDYYRALKEGKLYKSF